MNKLILTLIISLFCFELMGQISQQTLQWQNKTRRFIVYLPINYSPQEKLPLVINMHALTGTGAGQFNYTQYHKLADTARCIVAYPYGIGGRWNIGPFFGVSSEIDDVGFIGRLIDYMSIVYGIDARKVYATGYSAGGFMSHKLACELTNRITAIAPVAASMHPDTYAHCDPDRPVPTLIFNSVSDPITRYYGFEGVQPVEDVVALWSELNDCDVVPIEEEMPNIVQNDGSRANKITYQNCDESELVFFKFFNAGHTWPGAQPTFILGNTNQDVNATNESWAFFKRFTIPDDIACGQPSGLESLVSNNQLILSWEAISGIEHYSVFVIYPNGEKQFIDSINGNSITLDAGEEEGNLAWWVRAKCESGHIDWSPLQLDDISLRMAHQDNIHLFPNPTVDRLTIQVDEHLLNKKYKIMNSYGVDIMFGQLNATSIDIDITSLDPGIYFFKAIGYSSQKMFLKH
ncbi:MAG: T9SS type A sorting domain-containing protein [Chitinophagales bacterium]